MGGAAMSKAPHGAAHLALRALQLQVDLCQPLDLWERWGGEVDWAGWKRRPGTGPKAVRAGKRRTCVCVGGVGPWGGWVGGGWVGEGHTCVPVTQLSTVHYSLHRPCCPCGRPNLLASRHARRCGHPSSHASRVTPVHTPMADSHTPTPTLFSSSSASRAMRCRSASPCVSRVRHACSSLSLWRTVTCGTAASDSRGRQS